MLQLGAGGAGLAVAYGTLLTSSVHLSIYDTDASKALAVVERFQGHFGKHRVTATKDLPGALKYADGLINATPVGMEEYPGMPIPLNGLRPNMWVVDIIYFPWETELIRQAKQVGCHVVNGSAMTAHQAARQIQLFTGETCSPNRMLKFLQGIN